MGDRQRGIEEIIQKAMQEGAFDKLPGRGQPLNWGDSPVLSDDWQLSFHLLKENGFAPDFIETRQSIEADLAEARIALSRSWAWRMIALETGEDSDMIEGEWSKAQADFEERIGKLNRQIRDYNLVIPAQAFYLKVVNAQEEIASLMADRYSS